MKPNMKRLINRLIEWLKAHGVSDADIADCLDYITK